MAQKTGIDFLSLEEIEANASELEKIVESIRLLGSEEYEFSLATYKAAQEVLDGYTNIGDMTHFRRKGNRDGYIIGNHVFY